MSAMRTSTPRLRLAGRRLALTSLCSLLWASTVDAAPTARGEIVDWPTMPLLDGGVLSPGAWRDTAAVREHLATNHFHFPTVMGSESFRQGFTTRRVIPMTCLVDRRGRLQQVIPGEMSEEDVLSLASVAGTPAR
jgi:hypothetical protein